MADVVSQEILHAMKKPLLLFAFILCLQVNAQKPGQLPVPNVPDPFVLLQEEQCSITVSTPFDTGLFVFIISVTITGPCSEINEKGEALAWVLLWQLCHDYKAYN